MGQTRVHIDSVAGLGNFMELEVHFYQLTLTAVNIWQVCMKKEQPMSKGEEIAQDLMEKLGIREEHLIDCAYIDLLDTNH